MTQIWIEVTAENGEDVSFRWGDPCTNKQIEDILEAAATIMERRADTIA